MADADEGDGHWVTIDGNHVFIKNSGAGPQKTHELPSAELKGYDANDHYSAAGYRTVNAVLRGQMKAPNKADMDRMVKDLDEATTKHTFKTETTLYRGMDAKAFKGIELKKLMGRTIQSDAYLSTSTSYDVADRPDFNRGVLIKIKVSKGATAANLGGGEKEMLLPRGSALKFNRMRNIGENQHGQKTTLIEAEYIPPGKRASD